MEYRALSSHRRSSGARRWSGRLLGALFPPTCILCGAPGAGGRDLCLGCAAELPFNRHSCPCCGIPFDGPVAALCGSCQRRAPPFARAIAALRYETPVPNLVADAKFRGGLNTARLLGEILADEIREQGLTLPQALLPVPLHPRRLAERGYNQALEIARVVGRALALPIDARCCRRVLATPPQAGLDQGARRRNLRGAFTAQTPLPWAHIAIVDDVMTTGSTVSELALVLRRAGAGTIDIWAVARTA